MNAFKVSIAYGICYCCFKKVMRKMRLEMATFFIWNCQIYFKIDWVQAINDINKLC